MIRWLNHSSCMSLDVHLLFCPLLLSALLSGIISHPKIEEGEIHSLLGFTRERINVISVHNNLLLCNAMNTSLKGKRMKGRGGTTLCLYFRDIMMMDSRERGDLVGKKGKRANE